MGKLAINLANNRYKNLTMKNIKKTLYSERLFILAQRIISSQTSISVCNQPPKANSAFHPSGVSIWRPASAGKEKAGMVHSVSGWTQGVQVKLWDLLKMRAIPERLEVCSWRGAIQIHVYLLHVY